jgi:hypothetical protein
LLANIPRLEGVARIVRYQHKHYDGTGQPQDEVKGEALPSGSRLLKIVVDLAQSRQRTRRQALDEMESRVGWYDPALLHAVRDYYGLGVAERENGDAGESETMYISFCDLAPGMVLSANMETEDGRLILCAGQQLTEMNMEKAKNFALISGIKEPLQVENPGAAP